MRVAVENYFQASDRTELFYRHWPAAESAGPALILLHRGHEHSGRLQHLVDELNLPDFPIFGWDARGHGRSRTEDDGNPTLAAFVEDLNDFVHHVSEAYSIDIENIGVIAQSVGAVLAATWVHDYAPKIRCMVLATPAFKVKLYVPLARTGLGIASIFAKNLKVNSYVKASALTHDPERIASYQSDPLIQRPISVKVLLGLYSTADRIVKDAAAITTATLMLISGKDYVVYQKPQHEFFRRLGSTVKEKVVFENFYHDTLGEKERQQPIAKARDFLMRMFAQPRITVDLLDADQKGSTKDEFDRLRKPLFLISPKGAMFGLTRLAMKSGGLLSEGIRVGLKTGFDSGTTLDYVYRNHAGGVTPIGRLIDQGYINSIGWRGIRIRKKHLEQLLIEAMTRLRDSGREIRIIDIAAGHGRYVLDAVASQGLCPKSVLLRDYSDLNVDAGRRMIREKNMEAFASYEEGDAFDRDTLGNVTPRPTLGVASGLYELFPENAVIRESLGGLADAIEPGGFLVYTGQPWHPQLEMIARVLPSHRNGQPWVMRRRTQGELDQLVEAAGFRKLKQKMDEWGIFTVSLAQRE